MEKSGRGGSMSSHDAEETTVSNGVRLGHAVRRAIDDIHMLAAQDELMVGDRLPSERDLAQELMVSRSTIRAALAAMREQGEIMTSPRRGGTIIATDIARIASRDRIEINAKSTRLIERPSGSAAGVPSMLASQGLECVTEVLDARICECPESVGRAFGFRGAVPLIRVERVRTVQGKPLSYEQTYVNQRDYPDFLNLDLTRSISQLLQGECGAVVHTVQEMIQVVPGFGRCATYLGLQTGAPVLCAVSRALGADGRVVVLSHDMFSATAVKLTTSKTVRDPA